MKNCYTDTKIIQVIENIVEGSVECSFDAEGAHYSGYNTDGDIVQIDTFEQDGVRYLEMGVDGNVMTEAEITDLFA